LQEAITLDTSERASRTVVKENGVVINWACNGTTLWLVENRHWGLGFSFELDCTESFGMICSRDIFLSNDTVPPMHRQLVMVLSKESPYKSSSWSTKYKYGFVENNDYHNPSLEQIDLHQPSII